MGTAGVPKRSHCSFPTSYPLGSKSIGEPAIKTLVCTASPPTLHRGPSLFFVTPSAAAAPSLFNSLGFLSDTPSTAHNGSTRMARGRRPHA
jgi:hypothetical protein